MTRFFEHQDRARRTTRVLLVLMALGVIAMAGVVYLMLLAVAGFGHGSLTFRPGLLASSVLGTAALVLLCSGTRVLMLRGGGRQVAEMLGGRLVSGSPQGGLEKRLLNVVEEMAIASGVAVPQVFVLDTESGINAFAAGLSIGDAVIAVTRGSLEKLTRQELQGVIAHEFSHVLNGDMRLNIRLMGIVFGIVCIGLLGRLLIRFGGPRRVSFGGERSQNNRVPLFLIGLGVLMVGSVGEFFGKLIKAAVSRQREFLADASAIQFTRDASGIAGALKKIGGFSQGARVVSQRATEASHFFFADIDYSAFATGLFATHPPLLERVRRIEPNFSGRYPAVGAQIAEPVLDTLPGSYVAALAQPPQPTPPQPTRPDPAAVSARVGEPTEQSLQCGRRLLEAIPAELQSAVRVPFSACAAVFALLLSEEPEVLATQRELIASLSGAALLRETDKLGPPLAALPRRERLPLAQLLAPALRELSRVQRAKFLQTVRGLIDADAHLSIFECVLSETLADRLSEAPRHRTGVRHRSLHAVRTELVLLLSLLAHAGDFDGEGALPAFRVAAARLSFAELELLPASPLLISGLPQALSELRALVPALSEQVVDACAHAVLADERVADDEITLLRAICAGLDCPLPPFSG
jgi:Zn-dependent protease with chaperone function